MASSYRIGLFDINFWWIQFGLKYVHIGRVYNDLSCEMRVFKMYEYFNESTNMRWLLEYIYRRSRSDSKLIPIFVQTALTVKQISVDRNFCDRRHFGFSINIIHNWKRFACLFFFSFESNVFFNRILILFAKCFFAIWFWAHRSPDI